MICNAVSLVPGAHHNGRFLPVQRHRAKHDQPRLGGWDTVRATAKDDAYESPLPIGTNVNLIVTTTDTRIVKTTMDGLGRTIKVETGDSNGTQSVVDTQYGSCACSPLGKVKQVSRPYTPGGTVYWTVYSYECAGRPAWNRG
jgi:hypothetical protein